MALFGGFFFLLDQMSLQRVTVGITCTARSCRGRGRKGALLRCKKRGGYCTVTMAITGSALRPRWKCCGVSAPTSQRRLFWDEAEDGGNWRAFVGLRTSPASLGLG
ncbi:hypothetical protein PSV09DRAFT_2011009 [Bipolaris maydis]|nr:hypothetical protein PSV09DRAFT_2011009 [Bipolaris maydis]